MRRITREPRPDWIQKVEKLGMLYHSNDDEPYWDESAFYAFSMPEVLEIEKATNELHKMCLAAVDYVIEKKRYDDLQIPPEAIPFIEWAWENEPPSIYGRFDFSYNGSEPPKLLEYNADTPTALLEGAVGQWHWLQELYPEYDQFNSIWEGLVEYWQEVKRIRYLKGSLLHLTSVDSIEDMMTTTVMRDTAEAAGLVTSQLLVSEIGWDSRNGCFVDLDDRRMWTIFKLYPWEWMLAEEFGEFALKSYKDTQWIEPIWKMILSNKAILAILWEMHPNHPYLLPAYLDSPRDLNEWVKKPLLAREGEDITIHRLEGEEYSHGEPYESHMYQGYVRLPEFDDKQMMIGSWVIDGVARGMGIRENKKLVITNLSPFVPHLIDAPAPQSPAVLS